MGTKKSTPKKEPVMAVAKPFKKFEMAMQKLDEENTQRMKEQKLLEE